MDNLEMNDQEKRQVTIQMLKDTREKVMKEKGVLENIILKAQEDIVRIKCNLLSIEGSLKMFGDPVSQDQNLGYVSMTSVASACETFLRDHPNQEYKAMEVFQELKLLGFKFHPKHGTSAVYTSLSRLIKYKIAERRKRPNPACGVKSEVWYYSIKVQGGEKIES